MPALLLDTHAWIWGVSGVAMSPRATRTITRGLARGEVFLSATSIWEAVTLGYQDKVKMAPTPHMWALTAVATSGVCVEPMDAAIAAEVAALRATGPHKDGHDLTILVTAIQRKLHLVTRDAAVLRLAAERGVSVIEC